jgi:hypothetical protein
LLPNMQFQNWASVTSSHQQIVEFLVLRQTPICLPHSLFF